MARRYLSDAQIARRCFGFAVTSQLIYGVATASWLLYPAMVYFERKRQSAAEVSYHVRFTSSFHAGKVALSAASFFSGFADVYLIVAAAILLFFLHRNNVSGQDNQPVCCNVRSVRLMRSKGMRVF